MGDSPDIQAPQADVQETSRESIAAQIEAVPEIFRTQQEYGGQFAGLDVANLQKYLPLLGELQRSEASKDIAFQREQFPTVPNAEAQLGGFLGGQDIGGQQQGIRDDLQSAVDEFLSGSDPLTGVQKRNMSEDLRSASLARGQTQFGFDVVNEARGIEDLRREVRQERLGARLQKANVANQLNMQTLNAALSTAGRVPIGAGQQLGFQQPGQLVQNVNPSNVFGLVGQNLQSQSAQAQIQQQQPTALQSVGSIFGSALGGFATGYGSRFGR